MLFSLVSCQKQPTLTFGSTYLNDNNSANIVVVDTSTVAVSTVFVDSAASAGTGYLQVGRYADPYFGTITSRAFIQMAPPSSLPTITNFDNYDSIGLILFFKKNNPFYGDSTILQNLEVHQVDTLYELSSFSHGFFSNSSLRIDPTPLGATSVAIKPSIPYTTQGIGDSVKIKLDPSLGAQLYNMIYNKSDTINKPAVWLKWFHGLAITPSSTSKGAIYGFQDSAIMRIYYHEAAAYASQKYIDFGITNKSYQFNNITADRTGTPLQKIRKPTLAVQTPPATSSDTLGNAGYVQPTTGLYTKMTFPYLQSIAHRPDYLSVLRAELIVRPVPGSWTTTWKLPPQLNIYYGDYTNLPITVLTSSSSNGVQTGSMSVDYLNPSNTVYSYDVTNLIKAQITNVSITAKDEGVVLDVPSPNSSNSFARVVIADATYPVKQRVTLAVYYIALYPHQ